MSKIHISYISGFKMWTIPKLTHIKDHNQLLNITTAARSRLGQFSQKNLAAGEKIRAQTDTPDISTFIQYRGFTSL
jgi:hypothetical protein